MAGYFPVPTFITYPLQLATHHLPPHLGTLYSASDYQ